VMKAGKNARSTAVRTRGATAEPSFNNSSAFRGGRRRKGKEGGNFYVMGVRRGIPLLKKDSPPGKVAPEERKKKEGGVHQHQHPLEKRAAENYSKKMLNSESFSVMSRGPKGKKPFASWAAWIPTLKKEKRPLDSEERKDLVGVDIATKKRRS